MDKLYKKSELGFSLFWIIIYVVGTSLADILSVSIGIQKLMTVVYLVLMCGILLKWIDKNNLYEKYGLCKPMVEAKRFLYYIPLIILSTCNFWYGLKINNSIYEIILFIISMICVGFIEELIFRGFLFKAMSKDGIKSAIIVSSITFGIGHIVNLVNGSGADVLSNLLQVISAIAFGFLFVIIFYKGKSLIPCIISHCVINSLSIFINNDMVTASNEIIVSAILTIIKIIYTLILLKTLPKGMNKGEEKCQM